MADGKRVVDSDRVYTVLITNADYLPGLFTLDHSLRAVGSKYPLVALYTDSVPAEAHAAIDRRGIPKQRIEYLLPTKGRDYSNDPRFYDCWSKLTPFSLTQYVRVVQLDADMLVRRNIDDLMHIPLDDPAEAASASSPSSSSRVFAAGHACVCNPLAKPHYPRDWVPSNCAFTTQHGRPDVAQTDGPDPVADSPLGYMNGGLQVVNPGRDVYGQILERLGSGAAADMDFADQSLLSDLYRGRWVALPYVYNALKTLRWPGVHDAIWRDDEVRVVHYILAPKPWDERDPATGEWAGPGREEDRVTHGWWIDADKERRSAEKARGIDDGY